MLDVSLLFHEVEDPRRSNATRHDLQEMLLIALLSALSGGEGCVDMERFGRAKEGFLRQFLRLEYGIPSHDAFSNLFRALDPAGLHGVLQRIAKDWAERLGGEVVAVDGKVLRRSFEDATSRSPLHLVQAFAADGKLVLGQMEVDGKSNEIPALPKLLELLDIQGRMVTADAMHTQRETALAVLAKGGDYVLALQGNQRALHEDVKQQLDHPPEDGTIFSHREVDAGHGRVETRTARITHDLGAAARTAPLAGSRGSGQGRGGAGPEEWKGIGGDPLLHDQCALVSGTLRPCRTFALGHRKLPALGTGRDDERGRSAQPQGPWTVQPRTVAAAGPEYRPGAARQGFHARQAQTCWLGHGFPSGHGSIRPAA